MATRSQTSDYNSQRASLTGESSLARARARARAQLAVLSGWSAVRLPAGVCPPSVVGERSSRSHDGSPPLGPAASWAIGSLGASLVRKVEPQAAGEQVTDGGLAVLGAA